jgi:protein-tyrosine phosphatase
VAGRRSSRYISCVCGRFTTPKMTWAELVAQRRRLTASREVTHRTSKMSVLFLCTGNYYRSRFAEELFNHRAEREGITWQATSRALALEWGWANVGPISRYTIEALQIRGITLSGGVRFPAACTLADLESADIVVAMKETEHRELIRIKFPTWEERVTYWNVHDIDVASPRDTLDLTDRLVTDLMRDIQSISLPD